MDTKDNASSIGGQPSYKVEHHEHLTDEAQLAQLGHKQELNRSFSVFTLTSLCLCLMATWEALSTVLATALTNGGAPCLFFNYVIAFLGSMCVVCSLAEIASVYPTAGGQYHWVAVLSNAQNKSLAAYATGWISVGGQITLTAAAAFSGGLQIQALITLNDDSYTPQRWQGMLIYWAVLAYAAVQNIWGIKLLPHVNLLSGIIHTVGFLAVIIVVGVMSDKNPSSFVFVDVANSSGWGNDGVSWLVGLASIVYSFLGYDAACHMAEELPNPGRWVPVSMVASVFINGLMGLAYCIILLYATGPLEELLQSKTGFPFIDIYNEATQSRAGATVLAVMPIFVAVAAAVAGMTSTSRTFWAFARDKATPFHDQLSKVDPKLKVPFNTILVTFTLQALLGLIYLGSPAAFNAVLSMAIVGMYGSYLLPIIYMVTGGRKELHLQPPGLFRLKPWLAPILNWLSIAWIVVVIIFSTFPLELPVSAASMNYTVVVISGWILFGAIYYMTFGRHKFQVPIVSRSVLDGLA